MITSENAKSVMVKLGQALGQMPVVPKSAKGYGYNYQTLDQVTQTIRDTLRHNNLDFIQSLTTENGAMAISTRVFSLDDGEWIADTTVIPQAAMAKMNDVQAAGASITYFRRYSLCSFFGICSEEDTDGIAPQKPQKNARQSNVQMSPEAQSLQDWVNSGALTQDSVNKAINFIKTNNQQSIVAMLDWINKGGR